MANMGKMRLAIGGILSTAVLGLSSAPVLAQGMGMGPESGFYAGAGAGLTSSSDVCDDAISAGATSCDDEDVGFKVFAGFKLNQYFAAEGGYVDLGEANADFSGTGATSEADGFQLAAVGTYPIEQFSLLGKVGIYFWEASTSALGFSINDDGTDIMFGVGGAFHFTPQLSVRGEWERFDLDGFDVDFFSASVIYNF